MLLPPVPGLRGAMKSPARGENSRSHYMGARWKKNMWLDMSEVLAKDVQQWTSKYPILFA